MININGVQALYFSNKKSNYPKNKPFLSHSNILARKNIHFLVLLMHRV